MAKEYEQSRQVLAAREAVETQEGKRPGEYSSVWDSQIRQAMQDILNRQQFRYNLNGDALYRQYREQAMKNGRLAMMDTMGQAAALTGGYGSSYAQSVGQQAYQQEMTGLTDRIPELYALAMEQYRQTGQELMNRYELLSGQEQQDYSRYRDNWDAWQAEVDRLWSLYDRERGFDYDAYRDLIADEQWQAEFDEDKRRYDQEWEDKHKKKKKQEPVYVYVPVPETPPATPPAAPSNPQVQL